MPSNSVKRGVRGRANWRVWAREFFQKRERERELYRKLTPIQHHFQQMERMRGVIAEGRVLAASGAAAKRRHRADTVASRGRKLTLRHVRASA